MMIDDRLPDELERIGLEEHASILVEFAASSRVLLSSGRRRNPVDDSAASGVGRAPRRLPVTRPVV